MLITDSREQKTNPLAPVNRGIWPDFAGVVMADSDSGDQWLRRMENPSHNSLSTGELRDMVDRLEADDTLKEARGELRLIMDELSEVNRFTEESNIDELSDVLADYEPGDSIDLDVTTIETKPPETGRGVWEDTGGREDGDSEDWFDDNDDSNEGGSGGDNSNGDESNGGGGHRNRRVESIPNVGGVRIVPVGDAEAIVSFNVRAGVKAMLSLSPAGADVDRRITERVGVVAVEALSGPDALLELSDEGAVVVEPTEDGRIAVRTRLNGNVRQGAFKVG